jgi:AraC-like DNA-binding protein
MILPPPPSAASRTAALVVRLCRARDLLRQSCGDVGIEQAAREAALSRYHFIRLFKATFGETPHQVLIDARLERAKQLLLAADLPVTQICLEVGCASLGSFTTLFTRRVGMPPAAYRQRARARAQVPASLASSPIAGCYSLMWGWPADRYEQQLSRSVACGELPQSQP